MCEMNGATDEEKTQKPSKEEQQESGGHVKFDIGDFVHNQRKIQLLLGPWLRVYHTIMDIVCWRNPYPSLFWLVVCCVISTQSPVYFIIIPLVYTSILMVLSGIKQHGRQGNKDRKPKYSTCTIKKKADDNDLNVKVTVEKQAREDIKDFIILLAQLETFTADITSLLDCVHSVLKWEDFKTSLCVNVGLLMAIFVLCLVPLKLIMLTGILCLFCLNLGFKPVARQSSMFIRNSLIRVLVMLGLSGLFPSKPGRQLSFESVDDLQDQWHDAQSEERDGTSEEGGDDDNIEEHTLNKDKKLVDSKSMLTQLADYRRKQKKMNSGKCSACDVPFSTILKKRQYCRHCGESFCSKCCSHRVRRSVFGATAPAAYEETVLVCKPCFDMLMVGNSVEEQ